MKSKKSRNIKKQTKKRNVQRAVFRIPEKIETYKYLFETAKHITTLNTGLLVFLASVEIGFFSGQPTSKGNIGIGVIGILISTATSLGIMFAISYDTQKDKTPILLQHWTGTVLVLAEIAAFILALLYLLGAIA